MWLINTDSLELEAFPTPPPQYAILSHVWTDEEVSFQDFRDLKRSDDVSVAVVRRKAGFVKVGQCCRLAKSQGLRYAWVDTCCIDKTSSAELSESINSMFAWYQSSTICFVYLADIVSTTSTQGPGGFPSRWYSRGWTLQELLAPTKVVFYNHSWTMIGTKWGMRTQISGITGISQADLVFFDRRRTSIAQKMSWASRRETTRTEDTAYCLLGVFGVHMPLIYGEGTNAFRRLQEELIKSSPDQTIFAWTYDLRLDAQLRPWGILAGSPGHFRHCGNVVTTHSLDSSKPRYGVLRRPQFSITNVGLQIELPLIEDTATALQHCHVRSNRDPPQKAFRTLLRESDVRAVIAILDCVDISGEEKPYLGIMITLDEDGALFHRVHHSYLVKIGSRLRIEGAPLPLCVSFDNRYLEIGDMIHLPFLGWGGGTYTTSIFVNDWLSVNNPRVLPSMDTSGPTIFLADDGVGLFLGPGTVGLLDLTLHGEVCTVIFGVTVTLKVCCAIVASAVGNYDHITTNYLAKHGQARKIV
ncbi:hypothetical protein OQA88_10924 [Cercophora sp. LCS_1]